MAVSVDKIVKLGEDEIQDFNLSNPSQELTTVSSKMAPFQDDNKQTSSNNSLRDQIRANVYALPENWPKIPQLKDHHWISELSNCKTPSVKRAVSHIELMQNVLEEWLWRVAEELKSRSGSQYSSIHGVKKQLQFQTGSEEIGAVVRDGQSYRATSAYKIVSPAATDMSVTGQSGHVAIEDDTQEILHLGAQEVIEEVVTLLAELENDRMEIHGKYMMEIKRAELLQTKIDKLQRHHLQELPVLVQREHEACLMDLTELHWHVAYTKRLQTKVQNRFAASDRQNQQLKEHIDFVRQHVPLVQEKLVLEVEAMDKIRKGQGDTDQELVMTQQRQAKAEMRSQEASTKANTERVHIKRELDRAEDDLRNISKLLNESQRTYEAYVHHMNDINKTLADNEREMEVLSVKNEDAKVSEDIQAIKVRDLQAKVTEVEFDHRRVQNENQRQEQVLKKNKDHHMHAVMDLEAQRKALEVQLWKLAKKNQERNMDIQDCQEQIAKCDQQKVADTKNITRINKEIERTTVLLEQTLEQHKEILSTNLQLQDQLQSEQGHTFHKEEKLKKTAESLRRQVQDEIHMRTVLEARISSDLSETDKAKFDSDKKKEKAKAVTTELEKAVKVVLQKVTKLQATKAEKLRIKEDLIIKIKETDTQYEDSSEKFSQTLGRVEPNYQVVKTELTRLNDQLQAMKDQSSVMRNKIEEMDAAQSMMGKVSTTLELDVQVLTAEILELNLQIESGKKLVGDLRRQFNDTLERLRGNESKHTDLQRDRQYVLKTHETDTADLIVKNKELATRYRQLQNEYIIKKEAMLRTYDERVMYEAAVTDMKQLKSLQSKLHTALAEYIKFRGLFSESELSKLEHESFSNGIRVFELQVNMERAINDISGFLNSQKEGKLARNVVREAANERKGAQPIIPLGVGVSADQRLGVEV